MSRPYQNSFDSIQSPLNRSHPANFTSPTSTSATGQPPSFKTNVNRAKTKRWVEAKSVSYDGDDWGDDDEYDDYGDYDEPPPPNPTGYRQQGQVPSVSPVQMSASPGGFGTPSLPQPGTVFNDHRRRYGDLPGQSPRVMSNPQLGSGVGRDRSNSFDEGDEKRAFSAGGQQPAPAPEFAQQPDFVESPTTQAGQTPATRFSQMGIGMPSPDPAKSKDLPPIPPMPENVQGRHPSPKQAGHGPPPLQVQTQPVTSTPSHPVEGFTSPVSTSSANYRGAAYPNNQRRTSSASRTRSIDSTTASDFQARRDFSPTALPPPLQTRASPAAPVSEVSSPSQFPPRKSSLSQKNPSYFPSESRGSPGGFIVQSPPSAPSRRESGSSIGRSRAGSNPGVSQPFVRPADIYRRVEEERQKERQSSESGRPSMDSIMRRTSDHDFASGSSDVRKEPSSENLRRGIAKKPSREDSEETETSRRLKPMLDPVTERRSEYGFDALLVNSQGSVGSHTEAPNLGQSRSPDNLEPPSTDPRRGVSEDSSAREQGRTPSLPQVNRVSGFGDDFWPATRHSPHSSETTAQPQPPVNSFQIDGGHSHAGTSGPPLNHQESQGFRSVVRQAFDRQDDPSVPPTPSSISGSQRSQDGSGVSRTDSHSTAGISPIMSRVPSAATALGKAKEAEAREAATPAIAEEPTTPEFKRETESTLSTPRNQSRKPSPSPNRRAPDDTRPAVFMPGHRRNQSTPSPRGSPARSPAVGVSHQVAEGEHAEIVQAQHTDARSLEHTSNSMASSLHHGRNRGQSLDYATREADVATAVNSNRHNEASETANSVSDAQSLFLDTRVNQNNSSRSTTPISRADSPSKGKVRDLAGRFDSNQSPISASPTRGPNQPSSSKSSPAPSFTPRLQDLTASRPATDRMQSFRPALPGGWVSYATTAGPGTPVSEVDPGRSGAVTEQNSRSTPTESPDTAKEDMDITPTTASRTLSGSSQQQEQGEDHSRGAFAAVAAAGAAMAEAITAAVGIENEPSQGTVGAEAKLPAREPSSSSEDSSLHASNDHTPTRDYQAHLPQPDEVASSSTDSATSSRPPTPPPKDTPLLPDGHSTSGYFPPTVPLSYRHTAGRSDVNMPPITTRPPMLPSLSTETSPNDQESDRLRKEIVRTLSPTSANLDPAPGFPSSVPTGASDSRESTLFPSEYESYWASAGEEDWAVQQRQLPQVQEERSTSPAYPHNQPSPTSSENRALRDSDATSSAHGMPSTSQDEGPALVADDHTQDRDRQKIDIASKPLGHSRGLSEVSHDAELSQLLGTRNAYFDQAQGREIRKEHNTGALHVINSDYEEPPTPDSSGKNRVEASPNQPMDGLQSVEREPASVTEQYRGPAGQFFEPGLELADENERREQGSSDSPSNPWGAIPGHGKQKGYTSQEKDIGLEERSAWAGAGDENEKSSLPRSSEEHTSPLAGVPPIPFDAAEAQPTPTQAAPQPKIPTFREILARKSAADRIHGYNLAREHVANVDSGLSHWLAITASQKPDLLPASAQPGINAANLANSKTSPTQATFGKGSPTSSQQPPQPYYQQYLSAQSSASTGPPVPGKGNMNTPASGTSQSFVGSGSGKLSSREVQAKGKDLLHTAGIFGGKANVAAKGLFAKGRSRFKGAGGDKTPPSPVSPIAASPDETRDLPNGLEHLSSDSLQDQHSSTWPLASSTPSLKDPSPRKSNESQPMEANDAVGTRLSSSATDSAQSNLPVETLYQGPAPSNPDHLDQRSTKSNGDQGSESQVDHDEFETDNLQGGAFPSPGVPQLPALRFSNTDTFGRISAFVPLSSLDEDSVDETHDRRDLAAEMMNGGAMAKGTAKTHPVQDSSTRDHEPDPDQKARFFPPQNVASNDASTAQKAIGPPKLTIVTRGGDGKESFSSGSKATEISPSVRVGFAQPESAVQPTGAPEEDMKGVIDSPSPKYEGPEDGVQSPEKPPRYSFDEDSPVLSSPPVIKSPSQVRTPTGGAPAQDDGQVSPDLDPPSPMQLPSVRQAAQPRRRRSPSPEVSPERQGEESTITQDQAGDQASPALLHPGIRRQSNAKSRNSTELRPFSFLPHSPGPEEMPRQDILTRDSPRRAQPKRAPSPIEERLSTHSQDRTSTSQPPSIQEPSSPRHCSRDLSNQVSSDKTQLSPSQRSSANDRGLSPHPVSTDPYGPPSPALRSKYYTPHSPSKLEEDQYFPHPQSPDGPPIHEHPAFKQDTPHLADNPLKPNRSSQLPKTDTRPQPTEYQLPAVTPPTPEISSPKPERASGRFKGFGNVTSDPGSPQVPAQPIANRTIVEGPPPERPLAERPPAQWTALAERAAQRDTPPPTTSPAELNRKKPKRSSLFSNLTKPTSTSQEPKVSPDLRADLLQRSLQSTPQPTEPAQPKKQQALPLASLPGLKGSKADKKASKGVVQRSHTSADSDSQEGKKKRFSGFGSLFGRSHGTTGHARNEQKPIPPPKKSRSPLGLARIPFPLQQQPQPDPREQFPYQQAYITKRLPTHHEEVYQTAPPGGYYAPQTQPNQYIRPQGPASYRQYSNESSASRERSAYTTHADYMRGNPQERYAASQPQHSPRTQAQYFQSYGPNASSHSRTAPSNSRPIPHLSPEVSGESQYPPLHTSTSSPGPPISPVLSMRSHHQPAAPPHYQQPQPHFQYQQYTHPAPYSSPHPHPAQYPPNLYHSSSYSSQHSQPHSPDVYSAPPRAHEYPYPRPPPSSVPTISNSPAQPFDRENTSPARERMHEQQTPWTLSIPGVDGMTVTPHASLIPPRKEGVRTGGVDDMPSYREAQWKTGNETDDDGGKLRPKSMEHTAGSSKAPTPPPKLPFNGQNATVKADSGKGSVPPSNIPAVERDVLKGEGVRREASSRDLKEVDSRIVRDEKEVHETNDDEDSEIVMSSTAYPGQEWMPWIGDVD